MKTEDGYIINKCLNGDHDAFGLLVDKYKAGVYALAYSRLHNFHDAEDVAQDVFIKVYESLHTLKRWDKFAGWLYRITIRMCINWLKINSRQQDNEYLVDSFSDLFDSEMLASYHTEQVFDDIREVLSSLPEIHREVLMLHYFGGMDSSEISNIISVSAPAIRRRLMRARSVLKEELLDTMSKAFDGKKLQAGFTLNILEIIKNKSIGIVPKQIGLPWSISIASIFITFAFISFSSSISIIKTERNNDLFIQKPHKLSLPKDGEYQIPIEILELNDFKLFHVSMNFDDGDVSNWVGGYYEGEVDLNNKQRGKPLIKASPISAKSGKYGLLFVKDKEPVKDREYGSSCIVSSPEFEPLIKKFQLDFDIMLFDYGNHTICLGENAPDETYDERTISNLGISFSHDLVSVRSKTFTQMGRYKINEFYHVQIIVDPLAEKFDITITGNLYDLYENPINKLSIQNLDFEFPIAEKGIRRINLYIGTKLSLDVPYISMGLDNVSLHQLK